MRKRGKGVDLTSRPLIVKDESTAGLHFEKNISHAAAGFDLRRGDETRPNKEYSRRLRSNLVLAQESAAISRAQKLRQTPNRTVQLQKPGRQSLASDRMTAVSEPEQSVHFRIQASL
jgi:hypothetical protein